MRHYFTSALMIVLSLGINPPSVGADARVPLGVRSNILIDDGRVIFAQSDGSVTALSLENGEILSRQTREIVSVISQLTRIDDRIVQFGSGIVVVMRADDLETIWQQTDDIYSSFEADGLIVTYKRSGHFQGRRFDDGSVVWEYTHPTFFEVVRVEGYKLVIRVYGSMVGFPEITLLDLRTGVEIFSKRVPGSDHYMEFYFDGERIYALQGPPKLEEFWPETASGEKALENSRHFTVSRVERIVTLDLEGNEIDSVEAPPEIKGLMLGDVRNFYWDGRVFRRGKTVERMSEQEWMASRAAEAAEVESRERESKRRDLRRRRTYELNEGTLTTESATCSDGARRPIIRFEADWGEWTAYRPYLQKGGGGSFVESGGRLIFGTGTGHIECIDIKTGESQWLYVFPTLSPDWISGDPLRLQALEPGWEERPLEETQHSVVLTEHFPTDDGLILDVSTIPELTVGRVIVDPEPLRRPTP